LSNKHKKLHTTTHKQQQHGNHRKYTQQSIQPLPVGEPINTKTRVSAALRRGYTKTFNKPSCEPCPFFLLQKLCLPSLALTFETEKKKMITRDFCFTAQLTEGSSSLSNYQI